MANDFLKNSIGFLIPIKFQYSRTFWEQYKRILDSEYWDHEKLRELQWKKLKDLLSYSYKHSKYYKRIFSEHGIIPNDIKDINDFQKKVPVLKKEDIRENLQDMICLPKNRIKKVTTGGSTGIPLGFYLEKNITYQKTLAFEWRHYNEGGYQFRDRSVALRGKVIKNGVNKYDRYSNTLLLSTYNMSQENMHEYVKLIEKFRPEYIKGYASAVEVFAKFIAENYPEFNNEQYIKSLFTSSETLYPHQLNLFKNHLKIKVYDKYGNSEQCSIIGQCRNSKYHDNMEYSFSEFLDQEDRPVSKGEAKLISTSFVNYAVPFIRYDTNDNVYVTLENNCNCGRKSTIIKKILGRAQDIIVDNKNNLITLTSLIFAQHFDCFIRIKQLQIHQEKIGQISIRLIPTDNFTKKDKEELINKIEKASNNRLSVFVEIVEKIDQTRSGKHLFLQQKLKLT